MLADPINCCFNYLFFEKQKPSEVAYVGTEESLWARTIHSITLIKLLGKQSGCIINLFLGKKQK